MAPTGVIKTTTSAPDEAAKAWAVGRRPTTEPAPAVDWARLSNDGVERLTVVFRGPIRRGGPDALKAAALAALPAALEGLEPVQRYLRLRPTVTTARRRCDVAAAAVTLLQAEREKVEAELPPDLPARLADLDARLAAAKAEQDAALREAASTQGLAATVEREARAAARATAGEVFRAQVAAVRGRTWELANAIASRCADELGELVAALDAVNASPSLGHEVGVASASALEQLPPLPAGPRAVASADEPAPAEPAKGKPSRKPAIAAA